MAGDCDSWAATEWTNSGTELNNEKIFFNSLKISAICSYHIGLKKADI